MERRNLTRKHNCSVRNGIVILTTKHTRSHIGIFTSSGNQYTEMKNEDVLKEIEELNKKEMEKDLADIPEEVPSEEDIENMKDNS